jgi:ribose transport system permease protein
MLIAIRAVVTWILQASNIICTRQMTVFNQTDVKFPILIVLFIIFGYIFRFTPFGTYLRAIGENEQAMTYTGISFDKIKMAAYAISGTLAGIAGVFVMVRNGGANNTMGSSMEMKVMLCLFLASIPVQGGSGTRMYKMIIGVLTYFVLDNGLTLLGGSTIINQLIRGIVLILALLITRIVSEQKDKRAVKLALEAETTGEQV